MQTLTERITAFNKTSPPGLVKLKYKAMSENAFRFFRGTCHLYYEDLAELRSEMPDTPDTWICGDLHLENFGSFKGNNRIVYFDLNDFDEAILAPASWELSRMLTSIFIGFDTWGIRPAKAADHAKLFLNQYSMVLRTGSAKSIDPRTSKGVVCTFLSDATSRQQSQLLEKLTVKSKEGLILSVDDVTHFALKKRLKKELMRFLSAWIKQSPDWKDKYEVMDVVVRVAGTGSVGLKRYLFLLRKRSNKSKYLFAEMKQARTSALAPYVETKQPEWEASAQRIIAVQRRMQYTSPAFLDWLTFEDSTYTFKEMQPTEDRIPFDVIKSDLKQTMQVIKDMATLTASAHLRSSGRQGSFIADELIKFGNSYKWQEALLEYAIAYTKTAKTDYQEFYSAWKGDKLL